MTSFREQYDATNRALIVDVTESEIQVEPVVVGDWYFHRIEISASGRDLLDALRSEFEGHSDRSRTALRLVLTGTLSVRERGLLDQLVDGASDLYASVELSREHCDLAVMVHEDDLSALSLGGYGEGVVAELAELVKKGGEVGEDAVLALRVLYRLTESQRRVEFATTGITIVRGPNESGKSSLVEALRLLLDFPHDSRRAEIRAIKPVQGDFGPEVAALLELGGVVFEYRKRWIRDAVTELRVLEPAPQQFSGREAHDFVSHQLDSNLDRALFDALRFVQGEAVAQHSLVRSTSLMTSLDAATSAVARELDAGSTLQDAIHKEYERYFTSTGKPRDDRRRLQEAVKKSQADLDGARSDLESLELLGDSLRRTLAEMAERDHEISLVTARDEELANEERRCVELKRLLDVAAGDLERAEAQVETQERVLRERHRLIKEHEHAGCELTELREDLRNLQEELAALGERVRNETEARSGAQQELDEARRKTQEADELLERCRQVEELARVERQLHLAQEAQADVDAALAVISEHAGIGPEVLVELQVALDRVTECEAQVRAGETTLAFRALRESVLEVDGFREMLGEAEIRNRVARAGTRFVVDDALEIVVQGPSLVELDNKLTGATAALGELVREHRLDARSPRSDLEERLRNKVDAEAKYKQGERRLGDALDASSAVELARRLEELRGATAGGLVGPSLGEASKKSKLARSQQKDKEDRVQRLEGGENALKRTWDEKRQERANLGGRLQAVSKDLERASAVLEEARAIHDDAMLEQELSLAKTSHGEAGKH